MTTPNPDDKAPPVQDPPPASSPGKKPDDKAEPKYTEADLTQRLQGSGKELKKLQAELKKLQDERDDRDRKALEEQGEYKTLHEQAAAERDEYKGKYTTLQERETKRLENVITANKERTKALPDGLKALIPPGLDPDSTSAQIARLEGMVKDNVVQVPGGTPRSGPDSDDPDQLRERSQGDYQKLVFGKGK